MASNFPGLKDPRRQSRLGRLADRDVELGHAREWSRERLAAARRAEDEAATYKAATRRDIAGATESTGLGRAPSDALRENLEKALVKPSLLGMTAPLALSVPTTTAGKVIGGGIGAALGGIGGEDPYFSALSMLHPTLAMAQMVNAAYRDEPMLPITDAQGAGFPRRLIDLPGPARTARRYTPDERTSMLNELAPYARPRVLNPKASNILTSVLDDAVKQNETTVLYDRFNKPVSMYSMAGRGEPFDDSSYLSGLVSLNGPAGTGRQAAQHAARNSPLEGFRLFNTPTSKGFWDRIIETEPDWSLQYMPEHGLSAYRYLPPIKFAGGGSVAGAAKRFAQRAMSQAGDVDPVVAPRGALSVIKNKGGNWLTGSVEDALKGLKRDNLPSGVVETNPTHPNVLNQTSINRWIDKQLTRYVKNEMATPEDPIRALAERGILHVPQQRTSGYYLTGNRAAGGFPEEGLAKNELARGWEYMTDVAINPLRAKDFFSSKTGASRFPSTTEANPWLSKVAPETPVYEQLYATTGPLGFDHLIDELSNAMNPESGLPRHLLLDPKSLERVSVPQAVERVAQINAWRAEQARLADLEKMKANLTQKPYKEYEGGWRWAELPDADTPEGVKLVNDIGCQGGWCTQGESAAKSYGSHKGGNKLYALIDAEGRPHVQVQTRNKPLDENIRAAQEQFDDMWEDYVDPELVRTHEMEKIPSILQIKPFSNSWDSQMVKDFTKKNPEYRKQLEPMIQDFVKSGQWSAVGDLRNAGMLEFRQPVTVRGDAREITIPTGRYAPEDLRQYFESPEVHPELSEAQLKAFLERHGFAAGGLARIAARTSKDAAPARKGIGSIIKEKGGNWLDNSVEEAVGAFKTHQNPEAALAHANDLRATSTDPDLLALVGREEPRWLREGAINSFINKQLTRYIKNEMATPEDPVRALAERGILHFTPQDNSYLPGMAKRMRTRAGTPLDGVAQGPLAKHWENLSDYDIHTQPAGQLREDLDTKVYPWLLKLPEETPVYQPTHSDSFTELGFDHLLDELRNAMNPASGLPRNLQLDPKSMSRVSMPQAVERVSAINAWRAAQKAEADALRANNAATVLHKEYPEKGMRWVELKAQDGDAWEEANKHLGPKEWDEAVANFRNERTKSLQDALKYEGDTMGHCVGGYCDDVLSGRTKIYSLRDAKGQPHVTIETRPERKLTEADLPDDVRDMLAEEMGDASREEFEAAVAKAVAERQIPDRIVQIKGKQNRAPNPEYLPFVQDFVKSGQWSAVGDLQNTNLVKFSGGKTNIREGGHPPFENLDMPTGYMTRREAADFLEAQGVPRVLARRHVGDFEGLLDVPNYAQGGLVESMIEQNLDALVEKQTPKQMSRGGSVRTPIRAKIEKMTSELRQCRN